MDISETQKLRDLLLEKYGPMLSGQDLARALGYPSLGAVREAKSRGRLPIKIFKIRGRRGHFALTTDVAAWLVKLPTKEADM